MQNYSNEPKRPKSHQVGDNAEDQIRELFSSEGWIVNTIHSDYGDDLNVQLIEGSTLIPVRFYVQIKGTNNIKKFEKKGKYKIPNIKRTTVTHWLNSAEPTILILWDVNMKSGVYGFINEIFDDSDLNKKTKFMSANLLKDNTLDKKSIQSFKIDVISFHCDKRYVDLLGMQLFINKRSKDAKFFGIKKNLVNNEMVDVILLYLTSIGVVVLDKKHGAFGLSKKFHKYLHSELKQNLHNIDWENDDLEKEVEKALQDSIILALIGWRQDKFNHGTQSGLIDGSAKTIEIYFKDSLKEIRKLIQQN